MINQSKLAYFAGFLFLAAVHVKPVVALTIGQVDDFEDGTELGWSGHNPSITNIASGGPTDVDDNFLQLVTNGNPSGSGSRMVMFNTSQWTGDYLANGITGITADAINLGNEPIDLRLAYTNGDQFVNGSTWYASTNSISLLPGTGWQTVSFDLSDVSLVLGGDDLSTTLSNVTALRILSSVNLPTSQMGPSPAGDTGPRQLGLDNIRAIPEPTSAALLAAAMLTQVLARRANSRMLVTDS